MLLQSREAVVDADTSEASLPALTRLGQRVRLNVGVGQLLQ